MFHHRLKFVQHCFKFILIKTCFYWNIPKIGGFLKILNDDEVKDFPVKNFGKYLKPTREKLYSKLGE